MTPLAKVVRRVTRRTYTVLYVHEARAIVVSLEPGDVITFRDSGRRQAWTLSIDRMFRQAVRESVALHRREKAQQKRSAV
jgi:hypothetical protein